MARHSMAGTDRRAVEWGWISGLGPRTSDLSEMTKCKICWISHRREMGSGGRCGQRCFIKVVSNDCRVPRSDSVEHGGDGCCGSGWQTGLHGFKVILRHQADWYRA